MPMPRAIRHKSAMPPCRFSCYAIATQQDSCAATRALPLRDTFMPLLCLLRLSLICFDTLYAVDYALLLRLLFAEIDATLIIF